MGRTLETLKLGEGRRIPQIVSKPAETAPVQDCVVDWEIGAEVPFVEVGGPGKKVELSPGLMKHAAQVIPKPPHLSVETPAIVVPKPQAVNLVEAKPMTAAFAPWPNVIAAPSCVSTDIIAYHQPDHVASKEYAGLLDAMCRGLKGEKANVLMLVGMKAHVGASTVLLNLAVCAALQRKARVIVVDANAPKASLAQRLGQPGAAGLAEILDGSLSLEQAVVKTGIGALHLLAAGTPGKRPVTADAMGWLHACLRERYDFIFVDAPAFQDPGLALHVPNADGVYLVLPQGESSPLDKVVAPSIARMGGRLSGLIHTHFAV
jgi:Mrp family chromosome partitioning ATPase